MRVVEELFAVEVFTYSFGKKDVCVASAEKL